MVRAPALPWGQDRNGRSSVGPGPGDEAGWSMGLDDATTTDATTTDASTTDASTTGSSSTLACDPITCTFDTSMCDPDAGGTTG